MANPKTEFEILDLLDTKRITSQRQLSDNIGISLGQINYVLKRLLKRGWVKIGNFKKNPHKIGYVYLLTPRGIEAKSRLAVNFVLSRLKEYNGLRLRLSQKLSDLEKQGHGRLFFIGPEPVAELIRSVIRDQGLQMTLIGHNESMEEFKPDLSDSFDIALWLDENFKRVKQLPDELGMAREKLMPLW